MMLRSLLLAVTASVLAAEPLAVRQVILEPGAQPVIQVRFSHPLERAGVNVDPSNVTVTPAVVRIERVTYSPGRTNELQLHFAGSLATQYVQVRFAQIFYRDGGILRAASKVEGLSTEPSAEALERLRARVQQIPKSSQQRSLLASGFVTSAAGAAQGGAELSLNPSLNSPGMTTFLQLRKSTQPGGDAKHFETGFRYRHAVPWNRDLLRSLAQARTADEINRQVNALQARRIAGAVIDAAAKIEVAASSMAVSNFVGDVGVHLVTRTQRHWRGYAVPFAIEGGRSLNAVDWIARYKTGAGFTLFYDDESGVSPIRRAELDFNGMARQLFFDEARYGARAGRGLRGYSQLDLKLYVALTPAGRYGVKLSFHNGSLPPVYAPVRSVQVGFVFESADDRE